MQTANPAFVAVLSEEVEDATGLERAASLAGEDDGQAVGAVGVTVEETRSIHEERIVQERRVALVIGNSRYADAPLRNAVADAQDIAAVLKSAGFQVMLRENVNLRAMTEAVRAFGDSLRADSVAVFYYAGHGVQVRDRNYLIPVGADIRREDEIPYAALDVNQVLDKLERADSRVNIVILDACRNNPFARAFRSPSRAWNCR